MKINRTVSLIAAAMLIASSAFAAPPADDAFAALQGLGAQSLSTAEMQAVSGELNAFDIAAALTAKAATLGAFPKLQAVTVQAAAATLANATALNAAFAKLRVLTPCQSCTP